MTGYATIHHVSKVTNSLADLGLQLTRSRHSRSENNEKDIAVIPLNNGVPIYNREVEICVGSLEHISAWIEGVKWARRYDEKCGLKSDQRRPQAEQHILEGQLIEALTFGEQKNV